MRNNAYWLNPGCAGWPTSVCPEIDGRFFRVRYATEFLEAEMEEVWRDAELCPVVVVNFGQWWFSDWMSSYRTNYDDYCKAVDSVLAAFLALRRNDSLVWATMNPYPLPMQCKTEWRFLDVIESFNEGAQAVAAARNVSVWDTYGLLKHVFDLTYDGSHYKFPAALGTSLALHLSERLIWQTTILPSLKLDQADDACRLTSRSARAAAGPCVETASRV